MKWGLVGASDIAARRMIPAMRRLGHQPVVVHSGDRARAERFAATHGIAVATTDLATATDGVDAVYISTTNDRHAPFAAAVIDAGVPVLCEKPLALTANEAFALAAHAAGAGVVLATNHHLRHSPVFRTLAALVARGELGDIAAVRISTAGRLRPELARWRTAAEERGGGVLYDILVHDVDTLRVVTGCEVTAVSCTGIADPAGGAVTTALTTLELTGGALAQTFDGWTIPHNVSSFEVHGSAASVFARNALTQEPVGTVVLRSDGAERPVELPDADDLYERAVAAFAAALRGEPSPVATALDGAIAAAVAAAARESMATGRRVPVAGAPVP